MKESNLHPYLPGMGFEPTGRVLPDSHFRCLDHRFGGDDRDRTCDLELAKLLLSQLSYTPTVYLVTPTGVEPVLSA